MEGVKILTPKNQNKAWTKEDVLNLKDLAKHITPTGVIGIKLGRTEDAIRNKAAETQTSLKPVNQSPYNRKKK